MKDSSVDSWRQTFSGTLSHFAPGDRWPRLFGMEAADLLEMEAEQGSSAAGAVRLEQLQVLG